MSARLEQLVSELEPDAVRVLERVAERLVMGRKQYGDLDLKTDRRDWRRETRLEFLDATVYLACALESEES